mmetsp:Transcript_6083/g.24131  ORF Transcript_6083/g.24131 Transcript_6083/m.24131 type:complete len:234 (+) Transcript_6083:861-1562(+)
MGLFSIPSIGVSSLAVFARFASFVPSSWNFPSSSNRAIDFFWKFTTDAVASTMNAIDSKYSSSVNAPVVEHPTMAISSFSLYLLSAHARTTALASFSSRFVGSITFVPSLNIAHAFAHINPCMATSASMSAQQSAFTHAASALPSSLTIRAVARKPSLGKSYRTTVASIAPRTRASHALSSSLVMPLALVSSNSTIPRSTSSRQGFTFCGPCTVATTIVPSMAYSALPCAPAT